METNHSLQKRDSGGSVLCVLQLEIGQVATMKSYHVYLNSISLILVTVCFYSCLIFQDKGKRPAGTAMCRLLDFDCFAEGSSEHTRIDHIASR